MNLYRSVCSILPIIIYAKANISIPDYLYFFQQLSLYATGCVEIYLRLQFFDFLWHAVYITYSFVFDVYTTQSTVCSVLVVKFFSPPVCSPFGPVCLDKVRRF